MGLIPWFNSTEPVVGKGHATLSDTINRALRSLFTLSGLNPDQDFQGFATTDKAGIPTAADSENLAVKFPTPVTDQLVSVLARRGFQRFNESGVWEPLADSPTGYVTPSRFRHKAWGSSYMDGTPRPLTLPEIQAHPEWVGKYKEGVHTRDDVLVQEAIYAAYASHGVKARGTVSAVVNNGDGSYTFNLALDSGAAIDSSVGLVSSLPLSAGGLYNEGMKNAMFCTVYGPGLNHHVLHTVYTNSATSVTIYENDSTLFLPSVGDYFELVQFHGSGHPEYNAQVQLGAGTAMLTRAINMQFTHGARITGSARMASTLMQQTQDREVFAYNGVEYSHFEHIQTGHTEPSSRPSWNMDYTGPAVGTVNSGAVAANQSNNWISCFFGGLGSDPQSVYGNAGAAWGEVTAVNAGASTLTIQKIDLSSFTLRRNILTDYWIVFTGNVTPGLKGLKKRISFQAGVNAAGTLDVVIDHWDGALAPQVNDTFYLEIGVACGVRHGENQDGIGGGGPQGSESMYLACFFSNFTTAGVHSVSGNALCHTFLGGNIQSCGCYGIFCEWGNIVVTNVSVQNQSSQLKYVISNPTWYGYDFYLGNSAGEGSVIQGVRSESYRFLKSPGAQYVNVDSCSTSGPATQWSSGMQVHVGDIITGAHYPGTKCDGKLWICLSISGGFTDEVTSGVEPAWNTMGLPVGYALLNAGTMDLTEVGTTHGATITWRQFDNYLFNLHGSGFGMPVISASKAQFRNCRFQLGTLDIANGQVVLDSIEVSRPDWLPMFGMFAAKDYDGIEIDRVIVNDPTLLSAPWGARWGFWPGFLGDRRNAAEDYRAAKHFFARPLMWHIANGSNFKHHLGLIAADADDPTIGFTAKKNADTSWSGPYFAPPPPHIVYSGGFPDTSIDLQGTTGTNDRGTTGLTDLAGFEHKIAGGKGTGAATPGEIGFYVAVPGASGTTKQSYAKCGKFDTVGRFTTLAGITKSAVAGTIVIGAGGNATPNPSTVEISRYQINGAATFNNPTGTPVEGQAWTIEIFNNTAGALTPGFGSAYMGAAPSIGAGKWQTRRLVYDATLAKWKPTGAWSGDL